MYGLDKNGILKAHSRFLIICRNDENFKKVQKVLESHLSMLADMNNVFCEFQVNRGSSEDGETDTSDVIWSCLLRYDIQMLNSIEKNPRYALDILKEILAAFARDTTFEINCPGGAFGEGTRFFVGPETEHKKFMAKMDDTWFIVFDMLSWIDLADKDLVNRALKTWWSQDQVDGLRKLADRVEQAVGKTGSKQRAYRWSFDESTVKEINPEADVSEEAMEWYEEEVAENHAIAESICAALLTLTLKRSSSQSVEEGFNG